MKSLLYMKIYIIQSGSGGLIKILFINHFFFFIIFDLLKDWSKAECNNFPWFWHIWNIAKCVSKIYFLLNCFNISSFSSLSKTRNNNLYKLIQISRNYPNHYKLHIIQIWKRSKIQQVVQPINNEKDLKTIFMSKSRKRCWMHFVI